MGNVPLLGGVAAGLVYALATGAAAQAAPAHRAKAPAASRSEAALRSEVRQLRERVDALEAELKEQAAGQQDLKAQAEAAQARADQSAATAQAAQAKLDNEIIRLPTTVQTEIAAAPPPDKFRIKGLSITPGGFVEAAGIFRSRNIAADISSSFNAIPYDNVPAAHMQETRFSARQSRLSLLVEGDPYPQTHLAMYGEFDFQAGAQTANSNESNSFNPRIRHLYGTIDWDDWGLHLLAGQNWSLVTMNTKGITPRNELPPAVIDGQYVPGFVWARQPQLRLTKNFGKQLWLAASLENPQTTFFTVGTGPGAGTLPSNATFTIPAGSGFASTNTLSLNHVPDVVLKAAYEGPVGEIPLHLEVFGLFRDFYVRQAGSNADAQGGGFGGGAVVSVIPKVLDLQVSGLIGYGVGRYGTAQLPDATLDPAGHVRPMHEDMILAGATWHATSDLDLYLFAGREESKGKAMTGPTGLAFGYGNPAYVNLGCFVEGPPVVCNGNTREINQVTAGFWHKPYQGDFGHIQWGAQYSYTRREAFDGVGGAPTADAHMVFTSFRYYPY